MNNTLRKLIMLLAYVTWICLRSLSPAISKHMVLIWNAPIPDHHPYISDRVLMWRVLRW